MPRQLRIQYPGAVYHVLARGDRREDIVLDDGDRAMFVATLAEVCKKTGWQVLAWVLMDNHYHWLICTPEPNLVDGMKWFQLAYTQRFNARHKLWGHLFGGRYKAIPVQASGDGAGDYLKTLMDYIHLNPARARMVDPRNGKGLLDFPWSSVAQGYSMAPGKKRSKWLRVEEGLRLFELEDTTAGRRRFVERLEARAVGETRKRCGLPPEELCAGAQSTLRRGWYWGSQTFMEWLTERVKGKAGSQGKGRSLAAAAESRASHDVAEAERIIAEGVKQLGLEGVRLEELPGSDPRKIAIAAAVHERTAVPQGWTAEKLAMRSAGNVSQLVRRLRRGEIKLSNEARAWMSGSER